MGTKKPVGVVPPRAISKANFTMHIDDIELPKRWNRTELVDLKGLTQSIKVTGQLVPVIVRPHPDKDGKAVAVDGRRRLAVLRNLGITEVIVSFSSANNEGDAFLYSMVTNSNAKPNTAYELAMSYELLVVDDGKTNEEIAKSCGKTAGHVSQMRTALRVANQNRRLLNAFKKDKVVHSVFRHLAKLDPEKDLKFFERMVELVLNDAHAQDIGDKIAAYLEKKKEKETTTKKRGAAAHKNNAKVEIEFVDYSSDSVRKQMEPIRSKDKYQELLVYQTEKIRNTTKKNELVYEQGVLQGLEMACQLVVIENG